MSDSVTLKVAMAQRQSEAGYGRARIDSETRRRLGVELGDTIEIAGKRTVVAKVFKCATEDEGLGLIRIDGLTRTGAGISVDENVTVRRCEPALAEKVVLAPNIPDGKRIRFETGIENVFLNGLMGRPLVSGTDIIVPNIALMGNRSTFTVVSTVPSGPVLVAGSTEVVVRDAAPTGPKPRTATTGKQVTYDDVGGLDEELRRIREMIELPLKHPELFDRLGIGAPKGVLLYGPPGTGKTLIAEAVANESGAALYSIRGPEIIGQYYGQSEERLRDIFREAADNAPSVVFLDEIDSIAPNRDSVSGEVERRVVAQLLTLMDGLGDRGNVIVIGATNREDSIDPALRRPGRFDREIEIGVPGRRARADILEVHLRDMPLTDDVSIDVLAGMTQGFVGADLAALCREAAMRCLRSRMMELDMDRPVPSRVLESMRVSMSDFEHALGDVEPSGMREVLVEIPKVSWADVGGLDEVRAQIEEAFVPEEGNDAYRRLGIEPCKGILLYGPPGTGKTLIAKALANESGTNFISVNGPEVASKWMGESERAIRQIFKRAKQMAPCIIFFDEIDSIAPVRGGGDGSAWEKVVAQLLTSMDGVESMRNVTVMAATNRPDMIDRALLRPGRFDRMVLVGKPDEGSRLNILSVHTRDMPLDGVDLREIAARTDGYVGADLAALCREAGLMAYRESHDADRVCMRHFTAAMGVVRPSTDEESFRKYESISRNTARGRTSWDNIPFYG
ncbi:MAG: CDC48 family AAA ATPase [Candidatus Methanomethylophilaceae archaeon]|nr:CDC48 family AAA ATPase [Candidatus Methanomethylophilaceae archaeon]